MKTKKKLWFYAIALLSSTVMLFISCKKDADENGQQNTVEDVDGNTYKTVIIGNQLWFAENLRTTKYNNGTEIPLVKDNATWQELGTPAYCWYDNDQTNNGSKYGALYNWHTVNTGKLCPVGWHVPSEEEWILLTDYVGGASIAGTKLKATSGWNSSGNGTDEYGFSALPGSYRSGNFGTFSPLDYYGYWWSTAEDDASFALRWHMGYDSDNVKHSYGSKSHGLSVRCVKSN